MRRLLFAGLVACLSVCLSCGAPWGTVRGGSQASQEGKLKLDETLRTQSKKRETQKRLVADLEGLQRRTEGKSAAAARRFTVAELAFSAVESLIPLLGLFSFVVRSADDEMKLRMEGAYVLLLLVANVFFLLLRQRIHLEDDQTPVQIPPPAFVKNLFDTYNSESESPEDAAKPSLPLQALESALTRTTTAKEYDLLELKTLRRTVCGWGAVMLAFLYFKWKWTQYLFIALVQGCARLFSSPLVRLHVYRMDADSPDLQRPFKKETLFQKASILLERYMPSTADGGAKETQEASEEDGDGASDIEAEDTPPEREPMVEEEDLDWSNYVEEEEDEADATEVVDVDEDYEDGEEMEPAFEDAEVEED